MFLPEDFDSLKNQQKQIPLIFMLHGYGGNCESFKSTTNFETAACKSGYAVVYINGTTNPKLPMSSTGWHYGNDKLSKNDIDFIENLALYLQQNYGFSKEKTYAVGFSNGAFMCNKLALEKSKTFKAIVSAGGMMPENVWANRNKAKQIPSAFMQINGTKDEVVPMIQYDSYKNNPNPPMETVLEYICTKRSKLKNPPNSETKTLSSRTKMIDYQNGVVWVLIENEKHRWPSDSWAQVDINNLILDFFESL